MMRDIIVLTCSIGACWHKNRYYTITYNTNWSYFLPIKRVYPLFSKLLGGFWQLLGSSRRIQHTPVIRPDDLGIVLPIQDLSYWIKYLNSSDWIEPWIVGIGTTSWAENLWMNTLCFLSGSLSKLTLRQFKCDPLMAVVKSSLIAEFPVVDNSLAKRTQ
jgi:hypothetical protein